MLQKNIPSQTTRNLTRNKSNRKISNSEPAHLKHHLANYRPFKLQQGSVTFHHIWTGKGKTTDGITQIGLSDTDLITSVKASNTCSPYQFQSSEDKKNKKN